MAQANSLVVSEKPRPASAPTALVLGGGFGGLEAAIGLAARGVDVTLVSDRRQMFIYPTSIWMVTGQHARKDDTLDLDELAAEHGFRLVVGAVTSVDAPNRQVRIGETELTADHVVIALGAGRAAPPGTREHTLTIWGTPEDTERVHARLMELSARGGGRIAMGFGGNPKDGTAVRGGPVFEVLFNVDRYLRKLGVRDKFELSFFAPMENPGVRMGEQAASSVKAQLERLGIRQHVGRKITAFDDRGVVFEGGQRLDADLTVFVPAGDGHPVLRDAGLPLNAAGFVEIDEHCRVPGLPGTWAIGDSAALKGPEWRAKQGHVTVAMAKVAVQGIVDEFQGREPTADYLGHVDIVCLMDTGGGAVLVHRNQRHAWVIPLPVIGHWMKIAWGWLYKLTHRRWLPRAAPRLAPAKP